MRGVSWNTVLYGLVKDCVLQPIPWKGEGDDPRLRVATLPEGQSWLTLESSVLFVRRCYDDLWDKLDPGFDQAPPPGTLGAFYPPEGKYYLFSPYYTLQDLLAVPPSPPAMADFAQELTNATDNAALTAALTDITGPLMKAGNNALWPAPPVFAPTATMQDVINQM